MNQSNFTKPKVVKYDDLSKSWYVYFRYNGSKLVYKKGINYIKNYNKRLIEANALAKALYEKLKTGWNPLLPDLISSNSDLLFIDALDFAIQKKSLNITSKTLSGYNGTIKFIKKAIVDLRLDYLTIAETKRAYLKLILEKAKEQRSWSNKAYNKHLNHLKSILSELIQWDIIEVNPALGIKNLKVSITKANVPGTKDELEIIAKELNQNHYEFWVFILCIYYTGARPEEILKIKLKDIDLVNSKITFPAINTKTDIERVVPINPHFMPYIEKMKLNKFPLDYYLFGSFRYSGKGNVGSKKDFIPGPTKLKRDTATKRWKKIVKDQLGINMTMYAMKKHSANKMILAGVSIDAIKDLFGHTSQVTTQIYITELKEYNRQQIIDKAPAF